VKYDQAVRLREGRTKSGLTQSEAAQKLNVATSTYRDWEHPGGAEPANTSKLVEISALFNISIDWLLTGQASLPQPEQDVVAAMSFYQKAPKDLRKAISLVLNNLKQ